MQAKKIPRFAQLPVGGVRPGSGAATSLNCAHALALALQQFVQGRE